MTNVDWVGYADSIGSESDSETKLNCETKMELELDRDTDGDREPMPRIEVLIVGAGVGGLSAACALRRCEAFKCGRVDVRVIERRSVADQMQVGYPLRLSPSGQRALEQILTSSTRDQLDRMMRQSPVLHDGITVSSAASGNQVWRRVQRVGKGPMIEREALMELLRVGAGEVEYGVRAEQVREVDVAGDQTGATARLRDPVTVLLDGREYKADVVIGADGMFSQTRGAVLASGGRETTQDSTPCRLAYTTVNFRTGSGAMRSRLKDPHGINNIYGPNYSATLIPLPHDQIYVALTVPNAWYDIPTGIMRDLSGRADPFLDEIRGSVGWGERKATPLHGVSETLAGRGRVILVGDASHGMSPFCGAGASSAMVDAVELVRGLDLALRCGDNTKEIDLALDAFRAASVKRNNRLIAESGRLLWLAQGGGLWVRMVRRAVFWCLNQWEGLGAARAQAEAEIKRLVEAV
ncbi:hypothetical protein IAU60_006291 [Kwoniella sp. DSM 27419]